MLGSLDDFSGRIFYRSVSRMKGNFVPGKPNCDAKKAGSLLTGILSLWRRNRKRKMSMDKPEYTERPTSPSHKLFPPNDLAIAFAYEKYALGVLFSIKRRIIITDIDDGWITLRLQIGGKCVTTLPKILQILTSKAQAADNGVTPSVSLRFCRKGKALNRVLNWKQWSGAGVSRMFGNAEATLSWQRGCSFAS